MNRVTAYLLGPELIWLLVYSLVMILIAQNHPATPAGNERLNSLSWYLAILTVVLSFVPLFWAVGNPWWWLARIALAGLVGVFVINVTLAGAVHYGDGRDSGSGSLLIATLPAGWVFLMSGVVVVGLFTALKWNFLPVLKWLLIVLGALLGLLLVSCTTKKTPTSSATTGLSNTITADTASFSWLTELCEYHGQYDPHRYTEVQLQNTYSLWTDNWYLEAAGVATTPDELNQLRIDTLTREFNYKVDLLRDLNIVQTTYWKELKNRRIRAMQAEYDLKKLAIQAYRQPTLLRQTAYDPAGAPYIDALIMGDSTGLLQAWQQLHQEQKKQSGLPERLENEFREKYTSADQLAFARVELMAYGWWHYAKPAVPYTERDERMETEFRQLFTNSKVTCSEP